MSGHKLTTFLHFSLMVFLPHIASVLRTFNKMAREYYSQTCIKLSPERNGGWPLNTGGLLNAAWPANDLSDVRA